MSSRQKHYTVAIKLSDRTLKICKISFSSDSSYFVMVPYHNFEGSAMMMKATVNYAKDEQMIAHSSLIDVGKARDHKKGLKLSHHLSGLVQFSGKGITSGPGSTGVNIKSWPLTKPVVGPCFGLSIQGIRDFKSNRINDTPCIFDFSYIDLDTLDSKILILEGFFFGPEGFNKIRNLGGTSVIQIRHPKAGPITLPILFLPKDNTQIGCMGLWLRFQDVSADVASRNFFSLSGSTGNLRENDLGEKIADSVFCIYPAPAWVGRDLTYSETQPLAQS